MYPSRINKALTSWPYRYRSALTAGHGVRLGTRQSGTVDLVFEGGGPFMAHSKLMPENSVARKALRLAGLSLLLLVVLVVVVTAFVSLNGEPFKSGPPAEVAASNQSLGAIPPTPASTSGPAAVLTAAPACASSDSIRAQLSELLSRHEIPGNSQSLLGDRGTVVADSGWLVEGKVTIGQLSNYVVKTSCTDSPVWFVTTTESSSGSTLVKANPATLFERRG